MTTWTPEKVEALRAMRRSGLSIGQAAERLGVHRGSACWATARFGIGRPAADLTRPWRAKGDLWTEERLTQPWAAR